MSHALMKDKIYLDSQALFLITGHRNTNERLTVTESFAGLCYRPNSRFEADTSSNSRSWEAGPPSCPPKFVGGELLRQTVWIRDCFTNALCHPDLVAKARGLTAEYPARRVYYVLATQRPGEFLQPGFYMRR